MTEDGTAYKAADMTRKAVCGGLAGMIAKVRKGFVFYLQTV
jgi:hypothetical protein